MAKHESDNAFSEAVLPEKHKERTRYRQEQ